MCFKGNGIFLPGGALEDIDDAVESPDRIEVILSVDLNSVAKYFWLAKSQCLKVS